MSTTKAKTILTLYEEPRERHAACYENSVAVAVRDNLIVFAFDDGSMIYYDEDNNSYLPLSSGGAPRE